MLYLNLNPQQEGIRDLPAVYAGNSSVSQIEIAMLHHTLGESRVCITQPTYTWVSDNWSSGS
jgi:hypothetical protein